MICALAAGGAAFTAEVNNVPTTQVAGFHQTTINGAYAVSDVWAYSVGGQYVNSVTVTLDGQGPGGTDTGTPLRAPPSALDLTPAPQRRRPHRRRLFAVPNKLP